MDTLGLTRTRSTCVLALMIHSVHSDEDLFSQVHESAVIGLLLGSLRLGARQQSASRVHGGVLASQEMEVWTRWVRVTCTGCLSPACGPGRAPAHSPSPAEG